MSIGQGVFLKQTESDQDLVMKLFRVRLKKTKKPTQSRLMSDLEKLRIGRKTHRTDSIRSQISYKISRGKKDSTKRRHQKTK